VESKTPLDKSIRLGKSKPVDSELQADQFLLLMQWMRDGGYEHYEVSNYCLPGFKSRHNSSYWNQSTYIGLGPSAHSYNGIDRRWNVSNNQHYIDAIKKGAIPFELEQLSEVQKLNEYLMISLRTSAGIDLDRVQLIFGQEKEQRIRMTSEKWIKQEKVILNNHRLQLTDNGMLYADGIAADLFFT
jgi:oxygen-independent coproporphyrinogen-3 oxidase